MKKSVIKPFVFVAMPIAPELEDLYELGIKAACKNAGAYAERVDKQVFTESILDRIYNQISKADIIVADMTGRNPNVFYEVGYAHALGKTVILLTQKAEDIPFDLKHYPHIVYEGKINYLLKELQKRVSWAIEQASINSEYDSLKFYVHSVELVDNPKVYYLTRNDVLSKLKLQIDIFNDDENHNQNANIKFSLISSNRFYKSSAVDGKRVDMARTPSGNLIHVLKENLEIMPGAWEPCGLYLTIAGADRFLKEGDVESFAINVSSTAGSRIYPFDLVIKKGTPEDI